MVLLAINAGVSAAAFMALWLLAVRIRDVSFIDGWWALGMVMLALMTFAESGAASPHKVALATLCTLWGVRLGAHLFIRWRLHGKDRRYVELLEAAKANHGWPFPLAALLYVFALQAPLQFVVALPVQLGQLAPDARPLGPLAWCGVALALVGIAFETLGDAQLARFKRDPANKGEVMDRGLWRYTRHPNYFGDALTWVGLFLIAAETRFGLWAAPGPILLVFLLTRWSGAPTTEGRMRETRPGYADCVRRTPAFAPWFPRRG